MSLTELEFYKCKLCKEAELVAGKYCIGCSKKVKQSEKNSGYLNTKSKSPGYPFIVQDECSTYGTQTFTGASAGTDAGSLTVGTTTDFPLWTNFTAAGNATNTLDTSAFSTVSSGSAMDLGFGSAFQIGQGVLPSKRKKTRH